jgi:hypothetical protein
MVFVTDIDMKSYLWATVVVLVVLTCLGLTQVSAQAYFNGNYSTTCLPGPGNWIQCSGNLLQSPGGCIILGFIASSGYTSATQFYTLHNVTSINYPPFGSWVTVTGQLYQGYNYSPIGAPCPGNYINITSIT